MAQLALPDSSANGSSSSRDLINMDCLAHGFNVELSRESVTTLYNEAPLSAAVEPITRYYQPNFVGRDHINYVGEEPSDDASKVIISFLLSPSLSSSAGSNLSVIANGDESEWSKAIVRTKKEDHRVLVPFSSSRKEMLKAVVKAVPSLQVVKLQEVKEPSFVDMLVNFEENMGLQPKHKFGVLLCLEGQTDENQMFGNSMLAEECYCASC